MKNQVDDQIQELLQQIAALDNQIKSVLGIPNSETLARIERYMSDFTQRIGILLAVAGLLSGFVLVNDLFLRHFLISSFPLLLLSIIFYLLSARRINVLDENRLHDFNTILLNSYHAARRWHILADVSLTTFFVSFTWNIYTITFLPAQQWCPVVISYAFAALIGAIRYSYITSIPLQKNKPDINMAGTGVGPTDPYMLVGTGTGTGTELPAHKTDTPSVDSKIL